MIAHVTHTKVDNTFVGTVTGQLVMNLVLRLSAAFLPRTLRIATFRTIWFEFKIPSCLTATKK